MQLSASTFAARKSIDDSVTLSSDGDVGQMKSSSVGIDVQNKLSLVDCDCWKIYRGGLCNYLHLLLQQESQSMTP